MKIRHIKRDLYKSLKSTFYYYAKVEFVFKHDVKWRDLYMYEPCWVKGGASEIDKWALGTLIALFDDGKHLLPMISWRTDGSWNDNDVDFTVCWDGKCTLAYKLLLEELNKRLDMFERLYVGSDSEFNIVDKVNVVVYDSNDNVVSD